jgi:hypothetical protein
MQSKIVSCSYCGATGKVSSGYGNYATTTCPICFGRRQITISQNAKKCLGCNGTGRQYTGYHTQGLVKHNACHGTGWVEISISQPSLIISFPKTTVGSR